MKRKETEFEEVQNLDEGMGYVERFFKCKIVNNLDKIPMLDDVVALYFCLKDPNTPLPVKTTIVSALFYLILPADAIPDTIPGAGYTDDAGVLMGILGIVSKYINEEHKKQAQEFLKSIKFEKCNKKIPNPRGFKLGKGKNTNKNKLYSKIKRKKHQ